MRLEKANRLIELARKLAASAEGLTLDQIAKEFSVNRRTAERLRDAVRELYPTLEEISDGRLHRYRIPGGLDRLSLQPTAEELAELELSADRLESEGAAHRAETLRSLVRKLKASIRPSVKTRLEPDIEIMRDAARFIVYAGPRRKAAPEVMSAITQGLLAGRTITFRYNRTGKRRSGVEVVPFGMLYANRYFLVGAKLGTPRPFLWRLDRMEHVELGPTAAVPPDDFDLQVYAARSFGVFQDNVEDVSLLFSAAAASDAAEYVFHAAQSFERLDDGSLRVRFSASGMRELCWHLFTWGPEVTIEAPEDLKTMMSALLEDALLHQREPQY